MFDKGIKGVWDKITAYHHLKKVMNDRGKAVATKFTTAVIVVSCFAVLGPWLKEIRGIHSVEPQPPQLRKCCQYCGKGNTSNEAMLWGTTWAQILVCSFGWQRDQEYQSLGHWGHLRRLHFH